MNVQCLQVGPLGVCCYLFWDEGGNCAVVDPGGDAPRIRAALEQQNLKLRHIFLTHLHYDHIGAVDALRDADVTVWYCPAELEAPGAAAMTKGLMDFSLPASHYDEGSVIPLGALSVEVLRTPGHSRGSVCLRCGAALFTGDTLFAGNCGRVDLPGGDEAQMLASLRRLAAMDERLTVLSGHSAATTIAQERATNPYVLEALA